VIPSLLPHYTHHINPKLKHTYLRFNDEGILEIRSPGLNPSQIEALLLKKAQWIRNAQAHIKSKHGRYPDFDAKPYLYYLGTPYPVHLLAQRHKRTELHFQNSHFTLKYGRFDTQLFYQKIDRFYKEQISKIIPPIVEVYAKHMSLHPLDIRFQKTKRQWGSCSTNNRLSFNTMLAKLPIHTITYVVIHELAHIQYKHHQKDFWKLVEKTMPTYKQEIAILKTYTTY